MRKAISIHEMQSRLNQLCKREANPYTASYFNERMMVAERALSIIAEYLNEEHEWGGYVALHEALAKQTIHAGYIEGINDMCTMENPFNEEEGSTDE
ncbi:MAG: hypothetical protein JNN25_16525 [Candidatus Kapabacteria bacterium]|nr:hypothetical protein [Candidatus Kapabacteria bacterium]